MTAAMLSMVHLQIFSIQVIVTLISDDRCNVDEICALLGHYAVSCGTCLLAFWDCVSVPSRAKSLRWKESQPATSILTGNVRAGWDQ
jgi:hypothetical protein